jgi:hypothetical protein
MYESKKCEARSKQRAFARNSAFVLLNSYFCLLTNLHRHRRLHRRRKSRYRPRRNLIRVHWCY